MKWSLWSLGLASALALLAFPVGCTPSNKVPGGAPVMLSFNVIDPSGAAVELTTEAGTSIPVPPLSHFLATFDRLLDPTTLETLDSDGGIQPNQGVARVLWTGGSVDNNILYVPGGDAKFSLVDPPGPSLTVNAPLGLPSGASVMVSFDPDKVRSHDQTTSFVVADGVPSTLTFDTDVLTVSFVFPDPVPVDGGADGGADGGTMIPDVAADYVIHLSFDDLTADATMDAITAAVTVAGVPIPVDAVVARDSTNPAGWTVSPPGAGWPPGATITVNVSTDAVDNFGRTLAVATSASYTVAP